MNKLEYKKLCTECDNILMSTKSTIYTISIAWLHVIREHPIFLKNYYDIVDNKNNWNFFINSLGKVIRYRLTFIYTIFKAINNDNKKWYSARPLSNKIDIVFISHLVNETHIEKSEDFYYGDLPQKMHEKHLSALILYINHTGKSEKSIAQKWKGISGPNRLILSSNIGLIDEIKLYKLLNIESKRISLSISKNLKTLKKKVLKRSSIEALSSASRSTLRIGYQIEELIKYVKPKAVITTFEGHAFERVIFKMTRNINSNIMCIGYLHAMLFPLQHAIRRNLSFCYNPDVVLTSGFNTLKQLQEEDSFKGVELQVLGSIKHFNAEEEIRIKAINNRNSEKSTCLVLAEGYVSESIILFEFALKCALKQPDIKFILRLHPLIKYKDLLTHSKKLKRLPINVRLSNQGFDQDLEFSSWVLYRGTTAIFRAIESGLMPIYYDFKDDLSIDPLFELQQLKKSVSNAQEFEQVVKASRKISKEKWMQSVIDANNYCNGFYSPFNPTVLSGLLSQNKEVN